jgi:hypothetical protein
MTIIKLPNTNDSHTGRIKSCGEAQGNFGMQVQFDFDNGDTLYLPKDSADRQLGRLNLAYEDCAGLTLTFSRDPNPKAGAKPFWGISIPVGATPAPSGKRLTASEAARAKPHTGPLPTKPFDEPTDAERFTAFENALDEVEGAYEDPRPIHPARVDASQQVQHQAPQKAPPVRQGAPTGLSDVEVEYLSLFERVAAAQARIAQKHQMPFDASSVNATTFSIAKKQGIV